MLLVWLKNIPREISLPQDDTLAWFERAGVRLNGACRGTSHGTYVLKYEDIPYDPTARPLPDIPQAFYENHVKMVTLRETIFRGFQVDGRYDLREDMEVLVRFGYVNGCPAQDIRIKGFRVDPVLLMYRSICEGRYAPTINMGDEPISIGGVASK
jgi:hypothetical protein